MPPITEAATVIILLYLFQAISYTLYSLEETLIMF